MTLGHHKGVGRKSFPTRSANEVMGIPNYHKQSSSKRNSNTSNNNTNNIHAPRRKLAKGEIPYVSPDNGNTRYYADRYYIDVPSSTIEYQLSNNSNNYNTNTNSNNSSSTSNRMPVYCNKCGNKHEVKHHHRMAHDTYKKSEDDDHIGIDNNRSTTSSHQPLFNRSQFINSLGKQKVINYAQMERPFDFI